MSSKIFEFEIEGKKVGLRFGMLTNGKACRIDGNISLSELFKRLGITGEQQPDFATITNWFYSAALVYNESNKIPIDFTAADVSDWLDHIGLEKLMDLIKNSFETPKTDESKNPAAPETGQ